MSDSLPAGEAVLFSQGDGVPVPVESLASGQGTVPTGFSVVLWSHTGTPYSLAPANPDELASETGLASQNGTVAFSTAPGTLGATAAEVTPSGSDIGVVINSDNLLDGGAVPPGPMPFMPVWTPASPVMPFADPSIQALIASLDLQVPYMQSPGVGDSVSSGQIVLYFNLTDTKTSRTLAIGLTLFDSRGTSSLDIGVDNGPGGTGAIYVVQPAGQPSPYDVIVPGADSFESTPWTGERYFALEITRGTLSQLISVINANASPAEQFSTNPADYELSNVSVDAEIAYFGQQNSIGFSISNFQVAEATQPVGSTAAEISGHVPVEQFSVGDAPATIFAAAGTSDLVYGGSGTLDFIGGNAPSTVEGGSGAETASGGNALLYASGSAGATLLIGGAAGADTLLAGSGNATLVGSHDDLLVGGPGATTIFAGGGNNTIFGGLGGSAVTVIVSGPGSDMIIAGGGTQTIFTGSGADTVWGSADPNADVAIVGGSGPALVIGGAAPDQIWAGSGSQTIFGGTGGDVIETGSGADMVLLSQATAHQDFVFLGRGDATMFGGSSPDTYIVTYGQAGGQDVISGFRPGTDHLIFSGYGAAPSVEQTGAGASIRVSDGTQVLLPGVSSSLGAALS